MGDLFSERGTLALCVGSGYLSSFEVSSLKPGDVVRTVQSAGYPQSILLNGLEIARGEVVIVANLLGVRIVTTTYPRPVLPEPGRREELIELLPTLVSLGSIEVSLAELKGAGDGAIISLGKPFSEDEDAELSIAGIPAAWGKVVVLGEEMGLRLTRVRQAGFVESNIRISGYLLDREEAEGRFKDYDFRRPDKFSKNTIMKIMDVHDSFLRVVKIKLPQVAGDLVPSTGSAYVDQLTYGEACTEILNSGKFSAMIAENQARRRPTEAANDSFPPARSTGWKALIEEANTAHPMPAAARSFLEELTSETGIMGGRVLMIWYRTNGLLGEVLSKEAGREALLASLRGAWKSLIDLGLRFRRRGLPSSKGAVEEEPNVHENEMVVMVMFANREDGTPELALLYPYLTLEPYLGLLG